MTYDLTFDMLLSLKPLFFNSLKISHDSQTTLKHKTLESNKSVPFLPISVRGIFSYPIVKKWLTYISMYHQLSKPGLTLWPSARWHAGAQAPRGPYPAPGVAACARLSSVSVAGWRFWR